MKQPFHIVEGGHHLKCTCSTHPWNKQWNAYGNAYRFAIAKVLLELFAVIMVLGISYKRNHHDIRDEWSHEKTSMSRMLLLSSLQHKENQITETANTESFLLGAPCLIDASQP